MTDYALAARLIARFEGFTPTAAWDVNAFRLGFGSDTEGPEQRKVARGMTTTRERALANLTLRIPAYERTIVAAIGATAWGRLSDVSKAAILSYVYNYGSVTATLAADLKSGDLLSAVAAIDARGVDNKGINAKRRYAEAVVFAMGAAA
jgi:GH24 family phage-related lysozyme (muramidase)